MQQILNLQVVCSLVLHLFSVQHMGPLIPIEIRKELNDLNRGVQQEQREAGNSFVSRTVLDKRDLLPENPSGSMVVLRSVLMNPLTTIEVLRDILDEQEELCKEWLESNIKK